MANGNAKTSLAQDRASTANLYRISSGSNPPPMNRRDASNTGANRGLDLHSSDTSQRAPQWSQPPTPIRLPGSNPFTSARLGSNLNERIGNQSRSNTILPPNKKARVEDGESSKYFRDRPQTGSSLRFSKTKDRPVHKTKDIIDLSGDTPSDTNWQVANDPDGIDEIDSFASSKDKSNAEHPFARSSPPEGASTTIMRTRIAKKETGKALDIPSFPGGLENDDIESFPDRPSDCPTRPGNVQALKTRFETEGSTVPEGVKRLDFLRMGAEGKKTSKRQSMRDKNGAMPKGFTPVLVDPRSVESDRYTFGPKNVTRGSGSKISQGANPAPLDDITLPLDAYSVGLDLTESTEDTQYWFHLLPKQRQFGVSRGANQRLLKKYSVDELVKEAEFSNLATTNHDGPPCAILRFKTLKPTRRNGSLETPNFKLGSGTAEAALCYKFHTEGPNWQNGVRYSQLLAFLRTLEKKGELDLAASKNVWLSVRAACDLKSSPNVSNAPRSASSASSGTKERDAAEEISISSASRKPMVKAMNRKGGILSLAPPRETRSSVRQRQPPRDRSVSDRAASPLEDPDELLLVYPPTGLGAVNVTRGDLKRLKPHQYLNDTLIEYGLKLWLSDLRAENPELADQVHIFSSFFYKKLSNKNAIAGYESVRKWTSKIDIFSKKYLIVPINEHLHWYLAIICHPEYVLRPPPPPPDSASVIRPMTRKRKRESEAFEEEAGLPDEAAEGLTAVDGADSTTDGRPDSPSSHSRTASGSQTAAASVPASRQRSPMNEIVPDSEAESDPSRTQPVEDGKRGEETEVEQLLVLKHCSIAEIHPESHGPLPSDIDVEMIEDDDSKSDKLGYPEDPMDVDTTVIDVDTPDPQSSPKDVSTLFDESVSVTTVPVTKFYSTAAAKRKGKEKAEPGPELDLEEPAEPISVESPEEEDATSDDSNAEHTYIFIFDSLGTQHPGAFKRLNTYLGMEANDKKAIAVEQTSKAVHKNAQVPYQPNYCDCGVYVLHFVRKFMEDPAKFTRLILSKKRPGRAERAEDWDDKAVSSMRENLMARSLKLSEEWKQLKAAETKEAAERAAADGTTTTRSASLIEDSDDDVIVADGPVSAPAAPATSKAKGKGKEKAVIEKPALRLR
ncbi:hypothetical protein BXZ70DRAFT_922722 [Cristinia sonorae]|uniref:Ubiquitin-like protease family profile domain-containing protein n=1 Tax=Cristinia sonorae TaxID=1940300 RepID=A0A8K0UW16_9AGAR|nr:hypothetical protein BXZ70DRAFT_922722 [Cristinia sonorae]